jgi:hypothetical protein
VNPICDGFVNFEKINSATSATSVLYKNTRNKYVIKNAINVKIPVKILSIEGEFEGVGEGEVEGEDRKVEVKVKVEVKLKI